MIGNKSYFETVFASLVHNEPATVEKMLASTETERLGNAERRTDQSEPRDQSSKMAEAKQPITGERSKFVCSAMVRVSNVSKLFSGTFLDFGTDSNRFAMTR